MTSRQEQIWNRACLEDGGSAPREGDRALAALLHAHGLVMNGGVLHALDALAPQELSDAIASYQYFGLAVAANVLAQSYADTDEAEESSNSAYWQAVPNDETLSHAFRVKLVAYPESFAPVAAHA